MPAPVPTPADLTITPRNLSLFLRSKAACGPFDTSPGKGVTFPGLLDTQLVRWWHGGDPIATAYFNSLSAAFPQGETFFIDSVRRYRDRTDGALREQIDAFIQQEAMHTREHVAFNRLIKRAGYETTAMDEQTRRRIDLARSRHPIGQLAITVALEHFTAIMAHSLLSEARPLPGAPPEVVRLWQWHAVEEIEHKAVAYDTFLATTRHWPAFRRWRLRCRVMALMSLQFWHSNFQRMADFFRQDGINTPGTWLGVAKFLLISPGMLRRIALPYLSFYLPGFHPWNRDDRDLIAAAERQLSPGGEHDAGNSSNNGDAGASR